MTHPVDAYNHAEYVRSLEARLAEIERANVGLANESARLQAALAFYAERKHIELSEPAQWDNPDDEVSNWLCDAAGTATIEDGWMAREALKPFAVTTDSADGVQLTGQDAETMRAELLALTVDGVKP